jgi:hypothetical protein
MSHISQQLSKPEEEELKGKKVELADLESQLADRELELATLRLEFSNFERSYLQLVGKRYTELDEIEAQIAEIRASTSPKDQQAQAAAAQARSQARVSKAAVESFTESESANRATSRSKAFKSLYREIARRIHPDLATDPADRARRELLMAEANKAYQDGDEARLRSILHEYEAAPESVLGEGTAADLIRVIRKIAQVKKRLAQIERDVQALKGSEILQLKARADRAASEGRDLLREMAEDLDAQIAASRKTLQRFSKSSRK